MLELPDLEVIRAVLVRRIIDVPILSAEVLRPLMVRKVNGQLAKILVHCLRRRHP